MKRLILISMLSLLLLTGCQLASDGPEEGQLVGVYFTTDVVSIPGTELEVDNTSSAGSISLTEGQPGGSQRYGSCQRVRRSFYAECSRCNRN